MGFNSGFKGLKLYFIVYVIKNQLDTLFIPSFFRQSTFTRLGHICNPSSGDILYIYNNWYVLCCIYKQQLVRTSIVLYCAFQLTPGRVEMEQQFHLKPANRQSNEKHNTYQLLYIDRIIRDDELQMCPKHVEVDWQNKLRINTLSVCFLPHRCIETHCHQNIKKCIFLIH